MRPTPKAYKVKQLAVIYVKTWRGYQRPVPVQVAVSFAWTTASSICSNTTFTNNYSSNSATNVCSSLNANNTNKQEPTGFFLQQSFQVIERHLQLNNTRLSEIERIMTTQGNAIKEQGNVIKEHASKQKTAHLTPLPITPIRLPTTPGTPTFPRIPQPLLDLPPTPTQSLPQTHLNLSHLYNASYCLYIYSTSPSLCDYNIRWLEQVF